MELPSAGFEPPHKGIVVIIRAPKESRRCKGVGIVILVEGSKHVCTTHKSNRKTQVEDVWVWQFNP